MIELRIPGNPVAKGRPRFSARGGFPKAYTPQKTIDAEANIIAHFKEQHPEFEPLETPIMVILEFAMPIPKSWSKKKKENAIRHVSKPDLDNLIKLVIDALNGVAYTDDKQIYEISAYKIYSKIPCTYITITERCLR